MVLLSLFIAHASAGCPVRSEVSVNVTVQLPGGSPTTLPPGGSTSVSEGAFTLTPAGAPAISGTCVAVRKFVVQVINGVYSIREE